MRSSHIYTQFERQEVRHVIRFSWCSLVTYNFHNRIYIYIHIYTLWNLFHFTVGSRGRSSGIQSRGNSRITISIRKTPEFNENSRQFFVELLASQFSCRGAGALATSGPREPSRFHSASFISLADPAIPFRAALSMRFNSIVIPRGSLLRSNCWKYYSRQTLCPRSINAAILTRKTCPWDFIVEAFVEFVSFNSQW